MPDLDENSVTPPIRRMRHYADILNPLIWGDDFNHVDLNVRIGLVILRYRNNFLRLFSNPSRLYL